MCGENVKYLEDNNMEKKNTEDTREGEKYIRKNQTYAEVTAGRKMEFQKADRENQSQQKRNDKLERISPFFY